MNNKYYIYIYIYIYTGVPKKYIHILRDVIYYYFSKLN